MKKAMEIDPTYQSMIQIDENVVEIVALNLKGGMSELCDDHDQQYDKPSRFTSLALAR